MKLLFVLPLFLTVGVNNGQDRAQDVVIPGSSMFQRSLNPRHRRSLNSYFGLFDYMLPSPPAFHRQTSIGGHNVQGLMRDAPQSAFGRGRANGATGGVRDRRINPFGFGRSIGLLRSLDAQERSRRVGLGRNMGLGATGLYGATSGSGWRSYGGSSSGKGSYYYRMPGSSYPSSSYSYYNKGSYYRGGMGHSGHGKKYWS